MTEVWVGGERGLERLKIDGRIFRRLEDGGIPLIILADPGNPLAIGAVDENQHLAVRRHEVAHHRLDHEGAAALERHADKTVAAVHDLE